ncbi:MAG: DHH family phosphoesterase, partial [Thermoleophilia bacterium]|nr:DHH family phosphoesterase [Thermoleophilia bacterium]
MTTVSRRAATPADIAARFREETNLLIVSHENPDGDALGCVVALKLMADRLGIPAQTFIPGEDEFPPEYRFLPGLTQVQRGEVPEVASDTTVYLLDSASLVRSNAHQFGRDAFLVNIDHHQDNPGYGHLNLVDAAAPSTTVLLYRVFQTGGFPVDVDVATAL